MGELEKLVGDIGAKQWVKNRFIEKLQEYQKAGSKDVDKFILEFNIDIQDEFRTIAKEAVAETLNRASELMNNFAK